MFLDTEDGPKPVLFDCKESSRDLRCLFTKDFPVARIVRVLERGTQACNEKLLCRHLLLNRRAALA